MSWNTQKIESLKKLWDDGVATSLIGQQLGFTKNAVIGKAFRLGLERRQNSRKKNSSSSTTSTVYRETVPHKENTINNLIKSPDIKKKEKFEFKRSIIGTGSFSK